MSFMRGGERKRWWELSGVSGGILMRDVLEHVCRTECRRRWNHNNSATSSSSATAQHNNTD